MVLSGSMEPGFYRGDILFLYQPKTPAQTGDISAWFKGGGGGAAQHSTARWRQALGAGRRWSRRALGAGLGLQLGGPPQVMSCCLQEMRLPASASWPHVNRGMARRPAARPFRLAGPPPPPPAPCCCRSCPTPPRPLQLCSTPTAVRSPLCTAITFASSTRLLLPLPPRHATPAVVFNTDDREIPIVHRIIKVHERAEGSPPRLDILTKVRSVPAILPCVSRLSGTQPPHSCLGASGRK